MLARLCKKFKQRRDKCLIFSLHTQSLDIIERWVRSEGYNFRRIDGSTRRQDRQKLVDQFQNDDSIFCFLVSTKAGGVGLNLTAANRVIIFDVNWNPSSDEQAQDRSFRIGQQRNVQVYRLVARGTLEEVRS